MMGVDWEKSSDTIAISVRKILGDVTLMVSPLFFRLALTAAERERIQDMCHRSRAQSCTYEFEAVKHHQEFADEGKPYV